MTRKMYRKTVRNSFGFSIQIPSQKPTWLNRPNSGLDKFYTILSKMRTIDELNHTPWIE
jgi:hypothetical protein